MTGQVLAVGLAIGLAVTGCTGPTSQPTASSGPSSAPPTRSFEPFEGLTPAQILARAQRAVTAATSVRVTGPVAAEGGPLPVDLVIARGVGATGRVTFPTGTISLRRVGGTIYIRPDRRTLAALPQSELLERARGRWLVDDPLSGTAAFKKSLTVLTVVSDQLVPAGRLTRVPGRRVDGQATVGLRDDAARGIGTVYVAASGPPLPLLVQKGNRTLRLRTWNQPYEIRPPKNALNLFKAPARPTVTRA